MRILKSKQCDLPTAIEISSIGDATPVKSVHRSRAGWEEQLAFAIRQGYQPDSELLEGFSDDFAEQDWKW